jgi:uncharacterized membrane protein YhaH (DUF805 family)
MGFGSSESELATDDWFWPEAATQAFRGRMTATDPKPPLRKPVQRQLLSEISNACRFQGTLRRLPFALSFFGLSVVISVVSFGLRQNWLATGEDDLAYLAAAWGSEIFAAILVLPLCAARLRDIGWPAALSALVLVSPLLSTKLLVLIAIQNGGSLEAPRWIGDLISIVAILLLIGLAALIFKRGRSQPD